MNKTHLSPAARRRVLAHLKFPPRYRALNRTWSRLKARFPRVASHIGELCVDGLGLPPNAAGAVGIASRGFASFDLRAPRADAEKLARRLTAAYSDAFVLYLSVTSSLEPASERARVLVLAHELCHVAQHIAQPQRMRRQAATITPTDGFMQPSEVGARFAGCKQAIVSELPTLRRRDAAMLAGVFRDAFDGWAIVNANLSAAVDARHQMAAPNADAILAAAGVER
jgi:hypothetical protein